jgi:hypothetical protein
MRSDVDKKRGAYKGRNRKKTKKETRKKRKGVLWTFHPFGLPTEAGLPNGLKELL